MKRGDQEERMLAVQARLAAFVIAAAMLLWLAAQWLGGQMGWQAHYVFLFDLAALAAFFWGLVVTYKVWRKRRSN